MTPEKVATSECPNARLVTKDELFAEADVVCVNLRCSERTQQCFVTVAAIPMRKHIVRFEIPEKEQQNPFGKSAPQALLVLLERTR